MHYYKIMKGRKAIDLFSGEKLVYVKYQPKHQILLLTDETEAMGIMSDSDKCYHLENLLPFPDECHYITAKIEEIAEIEYEDLKKNSLQSADDIRENLLVELMERGVL